MPGIKKKWSGLKVEAKKRIASHCQSVTVTGGGNSTPELTLLDTKTATVLGQASVTGKGKERQTWLTQMNMVRLFY